MALRSLEPGPLVAEAFMTQPDADDLLPRLLGGRAWEGWSLDPQCPAPWAQPQTAGEPASGQGWLPCPDMEDRARPALR